MPDDLDLLTTEEAAGVLKVPATTLKWWRHRHQGPPWINLPGSNHVRYRRAALEEWVMGAETEISGRAVPLRRSVRIETRAAR